MKFPILIVIFILSLIPVAYAADGDFAGVGNINMSGNIYGITSIYADMATNPWLEMDSGSCGGDSYTVTGVTSYGTLTCSPIAIAGDAVGDVWINETGDTMSGTLYLNDNDGASGDVNLYFGDGNEKGNIQNVKSIYDDTSTSPWLELSGCGNDKTVTSVNADGTLTCSPISIASSGVTDIWINETGDTMSGNLVMSNSVATSDDIQFYYGATRMGELGTQDTTWLRINQVTNKNIYTPRYIRADSGFFVDGTAYGLDGTGILKSNTGATIGGNTAWHAGNDGSGSGLDADLLDGISSASFLRSDATDSASGAITFQNDLIFEDEIKPDNELCANGDILYKVGADDWGCYSCTELTGSAALCDGNDAVNDADSVIGNEVTGPTDSTLVRSGSGTSGDPYTLDIGPGKVGNNELAYNTGQDLTTSSAVTFATINTGQGANELYDMNQNVLTTSDVGFNSMDIGGGYGDGDGGLSIDSQGNIEIDGDITQASGQTFTSDETRYTGDFDVALTLDVGVGASGTDTDYLSINSDGYLSDNDDPVTVSDSFRVTTLTNCNTIDTDSSGNFVCGTDSNDDNYADSVAVTGTTTKTVTIGRTGALSDLTGTFTDINTNAGTICSAGQFLNGDGTCDTVPVDTNTDNQNLFETMNAPSGTDPVADSPTDILNFAAGTGMTITGDSSTDTLTFASTITDTNANTECTGTSVYLDGEGNCDTLVTNTDAQTLSYTAATDVIAISGGNSIDITEVNTNAGTICSAGQFLNGDGTCDTVPVDTNTNQLTTFTLTGDSGTSQTIAQSNTMDIAGGTNGIDTVVGATDKVTLNLDFNEVVDQINGAQLSDSITYDSAFTLNAAGANYDTKIEGDTNVNAFYLDASTNRIGIGTNTPASTLDINTGNIIVGDGYGLTSDGELNISSGGSGDLVIDAEGSGNIVLIIG